MRRLVLATTLFVLIPTQIQAQRATQRWVSGSVQLAGAQEPLQKAAGCRRSGIRKFGQWSASLVGAWAGGIAAFNAFDDPYGPDRKVKGDAGYTPDANTAYAIGSWVGSTALAIFTAPRNAGCRPVATAIGAAIPSVPLLFGREEPYLPVIGVLFVAPLQALGAVLVR